MARVPQKLRDLRKSVSPADRLLILIKPDPDALSSAWALRKLLTGSVQSSRIAHVGEIVRLENRAMLQILKIKSEKYDTIDPDSFTKVALVDGQPDQFDQYTIPEVSIVIDHHPMVESFEADFIDVRPKIGATATIMTEYLYNSKMKIPRPLATALCFGIKTDTNGLTRSISRKDVSAYSYLLPLANMRHLRQIEYERIARGDLELIGRAVSEIQVRRKFLFCPLDGPVAPDSLVILADTFIGVEGVSVVAVSSTYRNKAVIIFRGSGPRVNVGRVARNAFAHYGSAGGHRAAARAEIKLNDLPASAGKSDPEKLGAWIKKNIQSHLFPKKPKVNGLAK